jgi:photosystem II stability/assembly factor-like uncharacterized protein
MGRRCGRARSSAGSPARAAGSGRASGRTCSAWLRAIAFSDQQNGWMVGGFGLIFRTTDGGKTWLPAQG